MVNQATQHDTDKKAVKKKSQKNQVRKLSPFVSWWNQLKAAVGFSLRRLWFNPLSTWITLSAIAISLSLPAGLHVMLKNLQTLTDDKRQIPTITLFLKKDMSEQQAIDRADLISELLQVDKVMVVTKEQAFDEFRAITGFAETLDTLDENPLPNVLVVTPKLNLSGEMDIEIKKLTEKLQSYPEVETAQADIEWVRRLKAIINIAERVVMVVGFLLGLTVLLVVGNTIRLDIENRKEEIDVTRFIGATRSYIRRPFILGGLWYGLFGGVISLIIVHFSMLFLISPINRLSQEYGSHFTLTGLDFITTFYILIISGLLGVVGAWVAVSRHMRRIEVVL